MKHKNSEIVLDTTDSFTEDLLYCATRYAFGRHTGMAVGLPSDIAVNFYNAMTEKNRKAYAENCRSVLLNDTLRLSLHYSFNNNEEREYSALSIVLNDLIEKGIVQDVERIMKAIIRKDGDTFNVEYEFSGETDVYSARFIIDDILVWNDLFTLFAGETVTVTVDTGSEQREEECIESFILVTENDKFTYKRVYRTVGEMIKGSNWFLDPSVIIAIKKNY